MGEIGSILIPVPHMSTNRHYSLTRKRFPMFPIERMFPCLTERSAATSQEVKKTRPRSSTENLARSRNSVDQILGIRSQPPLGWYCGYSLEAAQRIPFSCVGIEVVLKQNESWLAGHWKKTGVNFVRFNSTQVHRYLISCGDLAQLQRFHPLSVPGTVHPLAFEEFAPTVCARI